MVGRQQSARWILGRGLGAVMVLCALTVGASAAAAAEPLGTVRYHQMVPMRDEVRLATDVYLPPGPGAEPLP